MHSDIGFFSYSEIMMMKNSSEETIMYYAISDILSLYACGVDVTHGQCLSIIHIKHSRKCPTIIAKKKKLVNKYKVR